MSRLAELLPFVTLGLLGSVHCAGMCGGFALLVAGGGRPQALRLLARQGAYILGKAMCYAVVGLSLSLVTHGLSTVEAAPHAGHVSSAGGLGSLRHLQAAASVFAGGALIAIGLNRLGLLPFTAAARRLPGLGVLQRALRIVRGAPGWAGAMGTGVVNGLVPCGLSWGAWLLAVDARPETAFAGCFTFGLASAPALVGLALGSRLTQAITSGRAQWALTRVLGIALVVFGSLALYRTLDRVTLDATDAGAACCGEVRAG